MTGPWAGLPVAWTDDDRIDEAAYAKDVERCCLAGMPGVYTGGTTGEFYAMEFDEFQTVARITVETCREHATPVMIGCTATSTRGAVRRAAFAAELGADAVQAALPFWMKVADDQVVRYFHQVAASAGNLALSVYETERAKRVLTLDEHRAIKDAAPNYIMVKSNAGTLGVTPKGCAALSQLINVFVGEPCWAELGPHGIRGSCSSMVYWNPRVLLRGWSDVEAGNWPAVDQMCARLGPLVDFLHAEFGQRGFTDTAFDRLGGLATGFLQTSLRSQPPYPAPEAADVTKLRAWFEEHFPEMLDL